MDRRNRASSPTSHVIGKPEAHRRWTLIDTDQEIGDRKGKTFNHKGHPFDSLTLAQGRLWDTKDGGKSR